VITQIRGESRNNGKFDARNGILEKKDPQWLFASETRSCGDGFGTSELISSLRLLRAVSLSVADFRDATHASVGLTGPITWSFSASCAERIRHRPRSQAHCGLPKDQYPLDLKKQYMDVVRDKTVQTNVYFAALGGVTVVTKLTKMACREADTEDW